jgi:hypothetical protein
MLGSNLIVNRTNCQLCKYLNSSDPYARGQARVQPVHDQYDRARPGVTVTVYVISTRECRDGIR